MERVILARESRGMNQTELAEKIGYTATNYSRIERGEAGLSEERLERIAEVTRYPVAFFHKEGGTVPHSSATRKREKVTQKVLSMVNAKVNVLRLQVQEMTRTLALPAPTLPVMEIKNVFTPDKAAAMLRKEWKIPETGPVNLTEYVEANGIPVYAFDLGSERIDSRTTLTDDGYPMIVINGKHTGDRQRFSLAYQLGHLLLHTFKPVGVDRDTKHEANLFAAELLMPEQQMRTAFANGVTMPILENLKLKWKVSMISLLYRADDLGFTTENQKRYLVQQFNNLDIRRREPKKLDVEPEQPRLIKSWLKEIGEREQLDTVGLAAKMCLQEWEYLEQFGN